jgi:predicted  nucleic acid-binding Zn-ribbon protein
MMLENLIGLPYINEAEKSAGKGKSGRIQETNDQNALLKQAEKVGRAIQIFFRKNYFLQSNLEGRILKGRSDDSLIIRNVSSRDKIWNLKLALRDVAKNVFINEIAPNQEWTQLIKENNEECSTQLKIIEKINRKGYISDLNLKSQLYLERNGDNAIYFTEFIENQSKYHLKSVMLTKNLPKGIQELVEVTNSIGFVDKNTNRIIWTCDDLKPGEKVLLKFKIILLPRPTTTGTVNVQYRIDTGAEQTFVIDSFDASAKVAEFVHINEEDKRPGFWNVSVTLLNRSDYKINISALNLLEKSDDGLKEITAQDFDKLYLQPFEEKTIYTTIIESKERPQIIKKIIYQPAKEIINDQSANLIIDEDSIDVLDIKAEKTFSVTELQSYEKSEFEEKFVLENNSTLPINHLLLKESFPKEFLPTALENLVIEINNTTMKYQDYLTKMNIKTREQELEDLKLNLTTIEKEYMELRQKIVHLQEDIDSNIEKYKQQKPEEITQDFSGLQKEIASLNEKIAQMNDVIAKKDENISKLNKEKDNSQKNLKRYEDLTTIKKDLNDLNSKLEKGENKKKELQNKASAAEERIKALENDSQKPDLDEAMKTSISDKMKEIQTEIANIAKEITQIDSDQKILHIEIGKKNTQLGDKKDASIPDLEKEIHDITAKINALSQNITSEVEIVSQDKKSRDEKKNYLENLLQKEKNLNQIISSGNALKDQIKREKEELKESLETLKKKKQEYLNSKQQRDRLAMYVNNKFSGDKIFKELYQKFDTNIQSNQTHFEVVMFEDNEKLNWLFVVLNHIDNIIGAVNPRDKIGIRFSVCAQRPGHDQEYKFPNLAYYDTSPAKSIQKYEIAENFLPKVDIVHKRHKISLGKIVDHYNEKGKFQVTLLIRNNGDQPVEHLELIDNLPQESSIENTAFEFTENNLGAGKKEILWKVPRINPHEEIELTYLLDLHEADYDIHAHEIFFK